MRNTLLASAAMLGLVAASLTTPAHAQNGSTQTPPSPSSSSQMPQPANSVPVGATTSLAPAAGSNIGGTTAAPAPRMMTAPVNGGHKPMHTTSRMRARPAIDPQTAPAPLDDASAPPTSAYRGGVGSPLSTKATNLTPSRGEAMGARLPDPNASGNTPRDLLMAAQRALSQGKTGAAQEALERAETRVLSRTTDPTMAGTPDQAAMVQNIAQARRALGARDMAGAKQAIAMAMDERTPARGPATTTAPAGVPAGGTF